MDANMPSKFWSVSWYGERRHFSSENFLPIYGSHFTNEVPQKASANGGKHQPRCVDSGLAEEDVKISDVHYFDSCNKRREFTTPSLGGRFVLNFLAVRPKGDLSFAINSGITPEIPLTVFHKEWIRKWTNWLGPRSKPLPQKSSAPSGVKSGSPWCTAMSLSIDRSKVWTHGESRESTQLNLHAIELFAILTGHRYNAIVNLQLPRIKQSMQIFAKKNAFSVIGTPASLGSQVCRLQC